MCMCGKPVKNGEPGYSWDGKSVGVRPVDAPELAEGDTLLYDEPGRCGGVNSHHLHLRVVRERWGGFILLVRHGLGDERIKITGSGKWLDSLRPGNRYWVLHAIFCAQNDAARNAKGEETARWSQAAAEKRIRTRRARGSSSVKVWIEPKKEQESVA